MQVMLLKFYTCFNVCCFSRKHRSKSRKRHHTEFEDDYTDGYGNDGYDYSYNHRQAVHPVVQAPVVMDWNGQYYSQNQYPMPQNWVS